MAIDLPHSQLELDIQSVRHESQIDLYANEETAPTDDIFDFGFEADQTIYDYDYKSPKKAFVYSLIIPGWGQRYCGSNTLKTLFFIGAEAASWMFYFQYHNDGVKKTDEYEDHADEFWFESREDREAYREWLEDNNYNEDDFTHSLPESKTQQYYEMIGKYDQFAAGWRDYWEDPAYWGEEEDGTGNLVRLSPDRLEYNKMRKDANDALDMANNFVIFAVVNHLVSAFDGALAAKRYNRNKSNDLWLSMETDMKKYSATESLPVVKFIVRF